MANWWLGNLMERNCDSSELGIKNVCLQTTVAAKKTDSVLSFTVLGTTLMTWNLNVDVYADKYLRFLKSELPYCLAKT